MQRASADFLPPDQAFAFQAVSTAQDQASFTWRITDGYYLYHDQIKVIENGKALSLQLPRPQQKDDPNFGMTDVHYGQVQATVAMQPKQSYKIEWQGCAESGLCYPVQRTTIHTDADGLLPESKLNQQSTTQKKLLDAVTSSSLPNTAIPVELQAKNTETVTVVTPANTAEVKEDENGLSPSFEVTALTEPSQASAPELDDALMMQASSESVTTTNAEQRTKQADWNNDQYFFYLLSTDNITLNLIIFLGLGILLAFLPCSLPLIPILSSILVQRHRGYRAGMIAGVFVVGMALIYALMGLAVAGLGYNFQRWLQSPIFIGLFAVMFVLFALNVFGIFQLSLPQGVLQRLDQWQQRQKGGTLWGSFIMGMISALIVGPCMSAPLAGALLFVAQLPEPWMGASYLFILGLGVGLPLLIACVFGAQYLPKPGVWMDRLKFTFGFVMLLLAVYFLRPLLPSVVYLMLMGLLCIGITVYILWRIRPHILQMPMQLLLIAMSLATAISGGWYVTQAWSQLNTTQATTLVAWQKVRTQAELEQALNKVKGQAVLIDVYADWCVACQPIEKEVLPRADVQTALDTVARIKLDLTEYEASQDIVLNDWQILGPPTMIFLDVQHQEQRNLRLTGTFSAAQLLSRLNRGTPP
ncbi:protein-disulfide reductase DsbD [Acinetobacter cumulans]|uniref:Protein-disulfide reductase DsbD n=1 Tax=Acinetobacter cumulans TaxID=2136182 RepID=A0A3A8GB31_9GAMM|nr:protein-disulfide reductase DsbD [Acinetobacter cumulans]RKG50183.1 protein-disulfide reductase DsbD [Acinetobacter cumulans]